MSHAHSSYVRVRRFRVFCTNQYWANRDEYDGYRQVQPHSFEEYVRENFVSLKEQFRPSVRDRVRSLKLNG
jgi:hypothetical protein